MNRKQELKLIELGLQALLNGMVKPRRKHKQEVKKRTWSNAQRKKFYTTLEMKKKVKK